MVRIILSVLLLFGYVYSFERCLELFKNEELLKAERCFNSVKKDHPLYPYSLYYRVLISSVYDGDYSGLLNEMEKYRDMAVYSYTYLYLASTDRYGNRKRGGKFLEKVNPQALDRDDLPFYTFLKAFYSGNKKDMEKLIGKYGYERFYGYPMFLKNADKLSEKLIYQAVDSMVRKRMYRRALKSLGFVKDSDKKRLYLAVLNGRLRQFDEAFSYLVKLPEKYRAKASYTLIRLNPEYSLQLALFQILKETKNRELTIRAADYMMKRAFYRKKWKDFGYFAGFIPEVSPLYADRVWYRFLRLYTQGKKTTAGRYLEKNLRYFKDKETVYYWLYLAFKNSSRKKAMGYLKKAASVKKVSFYAIRAREKLGKKLFKVKNIKTSSKDEPVLRMISWLKKLDYRWAYREAVFYRKKGDKKALASVFPEATAIYFSSDRYVSTLSHPKPFISINDENITYAIMRRESFFNPYAVSVSNAVGLMQIIPPTAKWISKRIKDRDFDITQLFVPEKNIQYGVWYIKYLNRQFKGNIFYLMAAYNCGPANVRKVLRKNRIKNIEEFIELIPFRETRYYVKYVYTNYRVYQHLYRD